MTSEQSCRLSQKSETNKSSMAEMEISKQSDSEEQEWEMCERRWSGRVGHCHGCMSERASAFGSLGILTHHKSLSRARLALREWYILFTLQRKTYMVLINHLPPLIMSQLPLIHHHFQSHACRKIQSGKKKEKQTEFANKVAVGRKRKCKTIQNAIVTFLKH